MLPEKGILCIFFIPIPKVVKILAVFLGALIEYLSFKQILSNRHTSEYLDIA